MSEAATKEKSRPARAEEVKGRRRRREGLGAERNLKLHVPEESKNKDFVYRWVNDRAGRVRQLTTMDDYEVVSTTELTGGDPDPTGNTAEGTVMKRVGDSRIGEGVVLVKKPREYFEADKREEQKSLDARDALLRKAPPKESGGLDASDNAYIPNGRNIIAGK